MTEVRELTCINCPLGCSIRVTLEAGKVIDIKGYSCERGKIYASKEVVNPERVVTSTIRCSDGRLVSCKTVPAVNKDKIFDCMQQINNVKITPPVRIGDVIIKNIADSGSDLIATKNID